MDEEDQKILPKGVTLDQFGRKVWDKEYFASKGEKREESGTFMDFGDGKTKTRLKVDELSARDEDFNLSRQVGRKEDGDSLLSCGFVCKACEESFNNNNDFLDHMNSSEHNFRIGLGMRAKKSTLQSVREKLRRKPEKKKRKAKKKKKKQIEISINELNRRIEERQKKIVKKPRIKKSKKTGIHKPKRMKPKGGNLNLFTNALVSKTFQIGKK